MALPIEDYAFLGDMQTSALIGADGSVDWLCLPRFDSRACFAALLGDEGNGRWTMAPAGEHRLSARRYRSDSLVLETEFRAADGVARVVDCMPIGAHRTCLIRRVEGVEGRVRMRSEAVLRFDYGSIVPWVRREGLRLHAIAGPDSCYLDSDVEFDVGATDSPVAEFTVAAGESVDFVLTWTPPRDPPPEPVNVETLIDHTDHVWREWASRCAYEGEYRDAVVRSLITLKALTHSPGGGIIAAATTSLPEQLGGVRNWDYRHCWIRDATLTLLTLLESGYTQAAVNWREWLLRAVAGEPSQMRIMYGIEGERRLPELELGWLSGYEGSSPVRIGNEAAQQWQLDVYGEVMDAFHQARVHGIPPEESAWELQRHLMDFLESHWREPDNGIWEMRGPRRHFTHSKIMAWTAVDRAISAVDRFGLEGPADEWRRLRRDIFQDVCANGYDTERRTFTQYYGSSSLDAALLMASTVGFLPATDERMRGTVAAVQRELCRDGLVQRYSMDETSRKVDALPPGEGVFLPCTFWLVDNLVMQGRVDEGRGIFEHLLSLRNDLGLLSEEYDPDTRRLVGNFPQALSHIALVNTAFELERDRRGPAQRRAESRNG
ncbi:glycoside hydrolase family 15 protein [Nocardiopsis halotolerans]|uniref:glycoside hydrolase family 15 protein n=1 Tax=Nocardiopsis halotolerans TaxID=124252 RepID=UPI0003717422|nr:glycoside hydrolase family 15 protein [Nocardiopsis halotolerans]